MLPAGVTLQWTLDIPVSAGKVIHAQRGAVGRPRGEESNQQGPPSVVIAALRGSPPASSNQELTNEWSLR